MKIQKAVALRVSNLLIKNNMSQYELAKRMLTDQSTIKHIIHEEYKSIKFDTLIKISDAFGMTVQEFLNDDVFKRENLDDWIFKKVGLCPIFSLLFGWEAGKI